MFLYDIGFLNQFKEFFKILDIGQGMFFFQCKILFDFFKLFMIIRDFFKLMSIIVYYLIFKFYKDYVLIGCGILDDFDIFNKFFEKKFVGY